MRVINIAILGFGTVGGGAYDIISRKKEEILSKHGIELNIKKLLERDLEKALKKGAPKNLLTTDYDEILRDSQIDTVVELIGGDDVARDYIIKALRAKKHVVTANKALLAKHWQELFSLANECGRNIFFEASCLGAIPIVRTLITSLQSDRIDEIYGIFNGTTNYILSEMKRGNGDFGRVLKQAQNLGYAEADPSADIDGYDAASKLAILLNIVSGKATKLSDIFCEGIRKVTSEDIEAARELGCVIKMLAIAKNNGEKWEARVHPCFVSVKNPLSAINDTTNAIFLKGDDAGNIMLSGQGAGAQPTASAVVSDIIYCAKNINDIIFGKNEQKLNISNNFLSKYYLRISVKDVPGMLAKVAQVFGDNNVSISKVMQLHEGEKYIPVIFLTHLAKESNIQKIVSILNSFENINSLDSLIRFM